MRVGDIGKRIEGLIIASEYKSVAGIVEAMSKSGLTTITANQLYELIKGQWPTRSQLIVLSDFFDKPMEYILFGIDLSKINKLTPEQRVIIDTLINHFVKHNENISPPPRSNK